MPGPTLGIGEMEHPEYISLVATVHVISSDDETHPAFQSSSKVFTAITKLLFLLIHSSGIPGGHSAALAEEGGSKGHISFLAFHFLTCNTAEKYTGHSAKPTTPTQIVWSRFSRFLTFLVASSWDLSELLTLRKIKKP